MLRLELQKKFASVVFAESPETEFPTMHPTQSCITPSPTQAPDVPGEGDCAVGGSSAKLLKNAAFRTIAT